MILLDTNALLWVYRDSPRLGTESRGRIDAADRVHFSAASVMEISIKAMLGRLEVPGGDAFPGVFARSGLLELTFSAAHGAALLGFADLARHDPFDRMLLAQAKVEGLTLLTSDSVLLSLGEPWIADATR